MLARAHTCMHTCTRTRTHICGHTAFHACADIWVGGPPAGTASCPRPKTAAASIASSCSLGKRCSGANPRASPAPPSLWRLRSACKAKQLWRRLAAGRRQGSGTAPCTGRGPIKKSRASRRAGGQSSRRCSARSLDIAGRFCSLWRRKRPSRGARSLVSNIDVNVENQKNTYTYIRNI